MFEVGDECHSGIHLINTSTPKLHVILDSHIMLSFYINSSY